MVVSLVPGITVFNEERVGGPFQCQGNGGSLARSETGAPRNNGLRRCPDD